MTRIRLLKKIIFIGEVNGYAIYFDTENNIPLKSKKSKLLDTEKSRSQLIYIVPLMLTFSFICKIVYYFFQYSYLIKHILKIALLSTFLGALGGGILIVLIHRALYKNVKKLELATKEEFGLAVRNNNFWKNFCNKKVTTNKKIVAWFVTLLMIFLSIASILFLLEGITLKKQIDVSTAVTIGLAAGSFPFVVILLVWENNMIRWLNVVEKYQKRKLWR